MGPGLPFDELTTHDYLQVMKTVRIAELKARLSEYLRDVRQGEAFTVLDGQTPVASLVPYAQGGQPLRIRQPLGRFSSVHHVPLPPPLKTKLDIVTLLLEERQGKR